MYNASLAFFIYVCPGRLPEFSEFSKYDMHVATVYLGNLPPSQQTYIYSAGEIVRKVTSVYDWQRKEHDFVFSQWKSDTPFRQTQSGRSHLMICYAEKNGILHNVEQPYLQF